MRRAILALAAVASARQSTARTDAVSSGHANAKASSMSRDHLRKILHTVLEDGPALRHLRRGDGGDAADDEGPASRGEGEAGGRGLRGGRVESDAARASDRTTIPSEDEVWDLATRRWWDLARARGGDGGGDRRLGTAPGEGFVVCSSAPDRSGHERLGSLLSLLGLEEMTSQVLYNADDESCFLLSAGVEAVHSLLLDGTVGDEKNEMTTSEKASEATGEGEVPSSPAVHLTVMPMLDLLKLPSRTAMSLLEDDWSPDLTSLTRTVVTDEFSYEDTVEVEETLDLEGWRRSILVDLLPSPEGETTSTGSEGSSLVRDVMDHVSSLADPTSDDAATSTTLREAFSLTAVHLGERARMFERHSIWSRALELGFESDHGCGNMMDGLEVRTRRNWGEESPGGSVGGFEGTFRQMRFLLALHRLGSKIL